MGIENRKYPRKEIELDVHIETDHGSKIACRLADLSQTGARVALDYSGVLPKEFMLVLSAQMRRRCRVMWRADREIGVQFVSRTEVAPSPQTVPLEDAQHPRLVVIKCPRTGRDIPTGLRARDAWDLAKLPEVRRFTQCPHCKLAHGWSVPDARLSEST